MNLESQVLFTKLRQQTMECGLCSLRLGCKQVVFGKGNPMAKVFFVGEAPGAQEDEQGLPFVGTSGKLLDKMIGTAGFKSEEVYIANVVKCRPPENRFPLRDEVAACKPYLLKQIALIAPLIVVTLGAAATQVLIDPKAKITKIRGDWCEINGMKFMPTFHPAALLRDPAKKLPVSEDLKKAREYYLEWKSIHT